MYLLQLPSFEDDFPINTNFDYKKKKKKRFLQNVHRWILFFYSNIDLCGGHLHFLRGMKMQLSVITMNMHLFTF